MEADLSAARKEIDALKRVIAGSQARDNVSEKSKDAEGLKK